MPRRSRPTPTGAVSSRHVQYPLLRQVHRPVAEVVGGLYERHIGSIEQVGGINTDEFKQMNRALQRLDRFWNDTIAYRM